MGAKEFAYLKEKLGDQLKGIPGLQSQDCEWVYQEYLARRYVQVKDGHHDTILIELGLSPMFGCGLVHFEAPTELDRVFDSEALRIKTEQRSNSMVEYGASHNRWAGVRLWLDTCCDQMPLDVLKSLLGIAEKATNDRPQDKATKSLSGERLQSAANCKNEDLDYCYARLTEMVTAGVSYPPRRVPFGRSDVEHFIAHRAGEYRPPRGSLRQEAMIRLNIDLNESIVGNYGRQRSIVPLLLLSMGAQVHSEGLSWHQGCFDDIFSELVSQGEALQSKRPLPPPLLPNQSIAKNANGDGAVWVVDGEAKVGLDADFNSWIAIFYSKISVAKFMVELGAPTDVHESYLCDMVVFTQLTIEGFKKSAEKAIAKASQLQSGGTWADDVSGADGVDSQSMDDDEFFAWWEEHKDARNDLLEPPPWHWDRQIEATTRFLQWLLNRENSLRAAAGMAVIGDR
eukprot:GFYU01006999.1.p1 GENE.GFYU01006999.1~~GFYU01006999.1.p1  ORF type:complete len:455 (-),score=66.55 GFYU01006999.1:95-1459(-)